MIANRLAQHHVALYYQSNEQPSWRGRPSCCGFSGIKIVEMAESVKDLGFFIDPSSKPLLQCRKRYAQGMLEGLFQHYMQIDTPYLRCAGALAYYGNASWLGPWRKAPAVDACKSPRSTSSSLVVPYQVCRWHSGVSTGSTVEWGICYLWGSLKACRETNPNRRITRDWAHGRNLRNSHPSQGKPQRFLASLIGS